VEAAHQKLVYLVQNHQLQGQLLSVPMSLPAILNNNQIRQQEIRQKEKEYMKKRYKTLITFCMNLSHYQVTLIMPLTISFMKRSLIKIVKTDGSPRKISFASPMESATGSQVRK